MNDPRNKTEYQCARDTSNPDTYGDLIFLRVVGEYLYVCHEISI